MSSPTPLLGPLELPWGTWADVFVAAGTLVLAVVALFGNAIRTWFLRPRLIVSVRSEPPDCVWVPMRGPHGLISNSVYLRLWVRNEGRDPARSVEVYAKRLERQRADNTWEHVTAFPPMNLRWSNIVPPAIYLPLIVGGTGKHCDLGHIIDPGQRVGRANAEFQDENNPQLGLSAQQCALSFDLMVAPNHMGHIVGPGRYRLQILAAAANARPRHQTVEILLNGPWYGTEAEMLRNGVGVSMT